MPAPLIIAGAAAANKLVDSKDAKNAREHELALQDPQAAAELAQAKAIEQQAKTRRRVALGGIAILSAAGLVFSGMLMVKDEIGNTRDAIAEAFEPDEISILDVQATINNVEFKDDIPVIGGDISGGANLHTAGTVFGLNFDKLGSGSDTSATTQGELGIIFDPSNETDDKGKRQTKNLEFKVVEDTEQGGFKLIVNAKSAGIGVDYSNVTHPEGEASDEIMRRTVGVVFGNNGGTRERELINYVDTFVQNACINGLAPGFEAGLDKALRNHLRLAIPVLEQLGDKKGVEALTQITSKPFVIAIDSFDPKTSASINWQGITPAVPSPADVAIAIDADPEHAQITPGSDCTLTTAASSQMIAGIKEHNVGN